ncbi:hypothetical protein FQA39_LY11163 [Lamprigera yunnana]|nr:hypothetical protein FQA39_LY11163 [Lamprigera yunnana]
MGRALGFFFLIFALIHYGNGEPPVLILAENLVQVVTSSTLQWVAFNSKQPRNLPNAVVGAYQNIRDEDEENSALGEISSEPVYICRAKQSGIWVSGQLRPSNPKCITSLRGSVEQFDRFEVLMNTEGAANLTWVSRSKYTLNPQGAVTGGDEPFRTFIARRKANSHNKEGSLTYFLGKFDSSDNLGKYTLVDQNNKQLEFEDGEILVETEPVAYELHGIKLDYLRKRTNQNPIVLGHVILKKEEESGGVERVDAVISYKYNYSIYWGHGHGLLTGLPLVVRFRNGTNIKGQWGLSETSEKLETYPIEGFLAPGTAVNVTLRGNYGEWETPYTAVVISIYKGGEKMERLIKDNQRERNMRDVMPEFGPVYFLHNNSFVPTTTTTTTTTTTSRTTITSKTTTADNVVPMTPPVLFDKDGNREADTHENELDHNHENNMMIADQGGAQSLKNKDAKDSENFAVNVKSCGTVLLTAVLCARAAT